MSISFKQLLLSCVCTSTACLILPAAAAAAGIRGGVDIQALGVDEPAILASNPFYGLTDSVRGMSVKFTSDKVGKTLALITQLNRKAAELIKMRAVAPEKSKLISKALSVYQLAAYQYSFAALRLTPADIAADERGAKLSSALFDAALLHVRFVDELLSESPSLADQAVLTDIVSRLGETNVRLFTETIGLESTKLLIAELPTDDLIQTIRNAEALALLAKRAALLKQTEAAQTFSAMRENLLDAAVPAIVAAPAAKSAGESLARVATFAVSAALPLPPAGASQESIALLSELAGSHSERIQTISYLLTKDGLAGNPELVSLRNQFLIEVLSK